MCTRPEHVFVWTDGNAYVTIPDGTACACGAIVFRVLDAGWEVTYLERAWKLG